MGAVLLANGSEDTYARMRLLAIADAKRHGNLVRRLRDGVQQPEDIKLAANFGREATRNISIAKLAHEARRRLRERLDKVGPGTTPTVLHTPVEHGCVGCPPGWSQAALYVCSVCLSTSGHVRMRTLVNVCRMPTPCMCAGQAAKKQTEDQGAAEEDVSEPTASASGQSRHTAPQVGSHPATSNIWCMPDMRHA